MPTLIKSRDLTNEERMLILRRREGITQAQAAARLNVPVHTYAKVESGRATAKEYDLPSAPKVGTLTLPEQVLLLRRRAKLRQHQIAGLRRDEVLMMELGRKDPAPLVEYWQNK